MMQAWADYLGKLAAGDSDPHRAEPMPEVGAK